LWIFTGWAISFLQNVKDLSSSSAFTCTPEQTVRALAANDVSSVQIHQLPDPEITLPNSHQECDANLFEVLIGQVAPNFEINIVLSKAMGVLGHAEFFEPIPNLLHRRLSTDLTLPVLDRHVGEFTSTPKDKGAPLSRAAVLSPVDTAPGVALGICGPHQLAPE
jgi:hypothetical protein